MNRTHASLIAAAALVIGVAAAIRFLPSSTPPPPAVRDDGTATSVRDGASGAAINSDIPSQAAAVISEATGTTAVVRGGARLPAVAGMRILTEDRIEAGEDGRLAIVWPHYGRTLLSPGTSLSVREAFESTDRETLRIRLDLEKGRIWTRLQRQLGYGSAFRVRAADIVTTADSASFGVSRGDRIGVQVMGFFARVARVRDRPALAGEIARGYPYQKVEEPVGDAVVVEEGEEIFAASGTSALPDPSRMRAGASGDPFIAEGDAVIPADVMAIEPTGDDAVSS